MPASELFFGTAGCTKLGFEPIFVGWSVSSVVATRSPTFLGATGGRTVVLGGWSMTVVGFKGASPVVLGATGGGVLTRGIVGPLLDLGMTNSPDDDGVDGLLDFFAAAAGLFRPRTGDMGLVVALLFETGRFREGTVGSSSVVVWICVAFTRGATGGGTLPSRGGNGDLSLSFEF